MRARTAVLGGVDEISNGDLAALSHEDFVDHVKARIDRAVRATYLIVGVELALTLVLLGLLR